jgi:protein tyrosine/serine phosphatase
MPICQEKLQAAKVSVPNLRFVNEAIVRGGQPEIEGLALLKAAGVSTVVNLCMMEDGLRSLFRKDSSPSESPELVRERQRTEELGMNFVHLPLDVFRDPPQQTIDRFLELTADQNCLPIFVHCLFGRDRTGLMMGIYRVVREGWAADRAYTEMIECGFDKDRTNLSRVLFAVAEKQQVR